MKNHNTDTRTREHHSPLHITQRGRYVVGAGALVLAGVGIGMAHNHNSTPQSNESPIDEKSTKIEQLVDRGPDDQSIRSEIKQDDDPGKKIERAVAALNSIDNLGYVEDQSFATWKSSKIIEEEVHSETGGSIQGGQETVTWRDDETGLILTTRYINDK
jgi:hypothetical protein